MTPPKHTHCKKCKHPLRQKRQLLIDHPGTKVLAAEGYCSGCWDWIRRNGYPEPQEPAAPETLASLNTYLQRRHQRINTGRHA